MDWVVFCLSNRRLARSCRSPIRTKETCKMLFTTSKSVHDSEMSEFRLPPMLKMEIHHSKTTTLVEILELALLT